MSKKGAGKDFLKGDLIETFIDTGYVKPMTSMLVIVIFATGIGYSYPFYCTLYTHISAFEFKSFQNHNNLPRSMYKSASYITYNIRKKK